VGSEGVAWAHAVHARTLGNPLYVGELLRHLADTGALSAGDGTLGTEPDEVQLPLGLHELIGHRVTRLGPETVRLLETAAALGPSFEVDVVDEVVRRTADPGGVDAITLLERAESAGIVAPAGSEYQFRHAIIRDVLLSDVAAARRRRLHREIADVLERRWALSLDHHLDEIAYHHGEGRTPQAASWYLRASRAAAALLDDAALPLADRGLELYAVAEPPDLALRCDLLIARAVGARLTGVETIDEARAALDAARAVGDQQRIADALLSVSLRSMADSHDEHLAFLTDGLRDLTDDALVARWNVEVALLLREFFAPASDPAEHRARVKHVVAHLDPADTLSCQIAMRCARSLTSTNQPRDAVPIVERFAANCDGIDTEGFPVEVALSTMWLHLGDRETSDRLLDMAARDSRRSYWFYDCQVLQRQVMRDLLDGRWSDAADGAAKVNRIGGHDPNLALGSESQLSWLRREVGDCDANLQVLHNYLIALPDFPTVRAMHVAELAEAGRHDEARSMLDELAPDAFAAVGRGWLTLFSITNVAWAAITVGASEHASTLRPMFDDYAGQIAVIATGTYVMGAVDRVRAGLAALAGDHDEADRLFDAALAQERALRSSPLEARTQHWWGRALLHRGDTARGCELLRDARARADGMAMCGLTRQIDTLSAKFIGP
jgi:tetratricopeptide (TPR) repeat protein